MKRRKTFRKIMRSPDMFRDSYQSFDVKTGERVSYLDTLLLQIEGQPEPEPPEDLVRLDDICTSQLSLF